MRANRMNGSVSAPTDSAYATLARLKVAFPIAQAASLEAVDGNAEGTVHMLADLTRDLADRLVESCFDRLSQLSADRRTRVMRSVAQEAAGLVGRAHERGERIDASRLIAFVKRAVSAVEQVPGATTSLPFTDVQGARVQWQLAVTRAAARVADGMMGDSVFCDRHLRTVLSNLLDRVSREAAQIDATGDEERLTVQISLLNHFSECHARIIERALEREANAKRSLEVASVLRQIDVYHINLSTALRSLDAPHGSRPSEAVSCFSPEI